MLFGGLINRLRGLVGSWRTRIFGQTKPDVHERIRRCRSIIGFSFAGDKTSGSSGLQYRLALRAKANRHLADAFGINNSLTTDDPDVHKAFLKAAMERIRNTEWQVSVVFARSLIKDELDEIAASASPSPSFPLAQFVRSLCLRVAMDALFGAPFGCAPIDKKDVATICDEINRLWMLAKNAAPDAKLEQSTLLRAALKRTGLGVDTHKALELLIPTYEALWRVVLLTFVTACHRSTDQKLHSLLKGENAYYALGMRNDKETELLTLVKEGLRLFPSSKRIYRASSLDGNDNSTISADVCGLHHDTEIWGDDALQFRPDRFNELSPLQKQAYMPFGLAPHRCPAYGGFGERLILLLLFVLGKHLGPDKVFVIYYDGRLDVDMEAELPTGRNAMEKWVVVMREVEEEANNNKKKNTRKEVKTEVKKEVE